MSIRTQVTCPVTRRRNWVEDDEPPAGTGQALDEDVPELPENWGELRLVQVVVNPEFAMAQAQRERATQEFQDQIAGPDGPPPGMRAVAENSFATQLESGMPLPPTLVAIEYRWNALSPEAVEIAIKALREAGFPFEVFTFPLHATEPAPEGEES